MRQLRLLFALLSVFFIPVFLFADSPHYRGSMISPSNFGEEDLAVFAGQWKGNLVRWQLNCGFPHGWGDTASPEEYLDWLDRETVKLDKMLPLLNQYHVKVCLDVHTAPGGFNEDSITRVFREEKYADTLVEAWKYLAEKYKNEPAIWAYDLMNEPSETNSEIGTDPIPWRELAVRICNEIRKIDPKTPIIFEPSPWGHARGFIDLEPIGVPNVIYSFHQYVPMNFTHQGVWNDQIGISYPGEIDGVYWDKEMLRESMKPVIEFQKKYNVPIFVGEFSAIRWAPDQSAYRYLKDAIEIFEEMGWDWTYHAYREWSGWSVEYTEDRENNAPAEQPTERELLLRRWFEKN